MPYCNVGRMSMSFYYLTWSGTQTLHAAGFYPAKWTAQFHAKKRIVKKQTQKKKKITYSKNTENSFSYY